MANVAVHDEAIDGALDALASDPDVTLEEYEELLVSIATRCRQAASAVHAELHPMAKPFVPTGPREVVGYMQVQFGHERFFCDGHQPETGEVYEVFAVECDDLVCHICNASLSHKAYEEGWLA